MENSVKEKAYMALQREEHMTIVMENSVKEKADMALYARVREAITGGIYRWGGKLPSKRAMAERYGVSVITVEHAYALLAEEGYVEPRERSGYFIIYKEEDAFHVGYR